MNLEIIRKLFIERLVFFLRACVFSALFAIVFGLASILLYAYWVYALFFLAGCLSFFFIESNRAYIAHDISPFCVKTWDRIIHDLFGDSRNSTNI